MNWNILQTKNDKHLRSIFMCKDNRIYIVYMRIWINNIIFTKVWVQSTFCVKCFISLIKESYENVTFLFGHPVLKTTEYKGLVDKTLVPMSFENSNREPFITQRKIEKISIYV